MLKAEHSTRRSTQLAQTIVLAKMSRLSIRYPLDEQIRPCVIETELDDTLSCLQKLVALELRPQNRAHYLFVGRDPHCKFVR